MKKYKEVAKFVVVLLLFFTVTSPFVVLFGPFDNIKRTVVGAILKSRHPQYITWLFSQDEIDKILGGISTAPKQELFKFKNRTDSTLKLQKIDSSRFKGFLLEIPDPKRVKVATAENMEEKGDTTSDIAKQNNAVAAINAGGFYDANGTGTGRSPYGFIIHNGKFLLGADSSDSEVNEFIGFNKDGNDVGYQARQSLIAIGSGRVIGRHYGNGLQKYFYLPERHTDYIFSTYAEEFGFIGCFVLIGIYFFILLIMIMTINKTKDYFGKYLVFGIMVLFITQALANMFVVTGVIPSTGITLPLISYGGSSTIVIMAALGIVINVINNIDEVNEDE